MSAIGPGDFVECIEADGYAAGALTLGGIYCVEAVYEDPGVWCHRCGERAVSLTVQGVNDPGFCVGRFRPIYRPKSSIIEQLKQPAPDAVRELITAD